jgi:hypothetical protein
MSITLQQLHFDHGRDFLFRIRGLLGRLGLFSPDGALAGFLKGGIFFYISARNCAAKNSSP